MNLLPRKKDNASTVQQNLINGHMQVDQGFLDAANQLQLELTHKEKSMSERILAMIPDFVQEFFVDIVKKALKQEGGKCMVLYVRQDLAENTGKKKKQSIEEQVAVLTLQYNPMEMKMNLEEKLAKDYQELQDLRRRNKFLEPKYQEYLKIIQDPNYQAYKKSLNDGK